MVSVETVAVSAMTDTLTKFILAYAPDWSYTVLTIGPQLLLLTHGNPQFFLEFMPVDCEIQSSNISPWAFLKQNL